MYKLNIDQAKISMNLYKISKTVTFSLSLHPFLSIDSLIYQFVYLPIYHCLKNGNRGKVWACGWGWRLKELKFLF